MCFYIFSHIYHDTLVHLYQTFKYFFKKIPKDTTTLDNRIFLQPYYIYMIFTTLLYIPPSYFFTLSILLQKKVSTRRRRRRRITTFPTHHAINLFKNLVVFISVLKEIFFSFKQCILFSSFEPYPNKCHPFFIFNMFQHGNNEPIGS